MQIPDSIENDSSYESDSDVLHKYKNDSLKYILNDDKIKVQKVIDQKKGARYRLFKMQKDNMEIFEKIQMKVEQNKFSIEELYKHVEQHQHLLDNKIVRSRLEKDIFSFSEII